MLPKILGSKGRAAIFRILFTSDHCTYHLRELARRAKLSAPMMQRELQNMVQLDLVHKTKDSSRMYYQANENCPLYSTLCELVRKTDNLAEILRPVFSDELIDCSFIFGSHANDSASAQSDIDLFIVGTIGLREITRRIHENITDLDREINPYIVSPLEFISRLHSHDHFISQVMGSNKIFLKGDIDELKSMEI